jgi:hypothetical protein
VPSVEHGLATYSARTYTEMRLHRRLLGRDLRPLHAVLDPSFRNQSEISTCLIESVLLR